MWLWDDKSKLTFRIEWNHKVTIWFTMSDDLSQITGVNSLGNHVSAVRASASNGKEPNPGATPRPNATPSRNYLGEFIGPAEQDSTPNP